jgi:hypothetical protein
MNEWTGGYQVLLEKFKGKQIVFLRTCSDFDGHQSNAGAADGQGFVVCKGGWYDEHRRGQHGEVHPHQTLQHHGHAGRKSEEEAYSQRSVRTISMARKEKITYHPVEHLSHSKIQNMKTIICAACNIFRSKAPFI